MRYDFFLAHASADSSAAEQLFALLSTKHQVFLDVKTLMPGDRWDVKIPQAQLASEITVVLISSKSEAAYYQREEIAAAIDLSRRTEHRIVPVFLDRAAHARGEIPYGLRRIHGFLLEESSPFEQIAHELVSMLGRSHGRTQDDGLQPEQHPTATAEKPPATEPSIDFRLKKREDPLLLKGHTSPVSAVALTRDGSYAVSAASDDTLRVWDLRAGSELRTLWGHRSGVPDVVVTPDDRHVLSASCDNTLRIWELQSGRVLRSLEGHSDSVWKVLLTPDGRRAVSLSGDMTLKVWDLGSRRPLHTLEGHAERAVAAAITPDGWRIISGAGDDLRQWDLETGRDLRTFKGQTGSFNSVQALAVTQDGRHVLSAYVGGEIKIWDLKSGRLSGTLEGHTSVVNMLVLLPGGRRVLSASWDRTLMVWDLESRREIHTLMGHNMEISALAVTPEGSRAVSASHGEIRVWDLESGRELRTINTRQLSIIQTVVATPDGRRVICGGYSSEGLYTGEPIRGTLEVWFI